MKKLTLAALTLTFCVTPAVSFADDLGEALCQYISSDDKGRMRDFIKDRRLNATSILGSLQCNGKDALTFAAEAKAEQTGKFIISKLPKGNVSSAMDAINASGLDDFIEAANKRVAD